MKFTSADMEPLDYADIVERLDLKADLPEFDCERADDDLIIRWTHGLPVGHEGQDGPDDTPIDVLDGYFLDGDDRFIG